MKENILIYKEKLDYSKELFLKNLENNKLLEDIDTKMLKDKVFCAFAFLKRPEIYVYFDESLKNNIKFNASIFNKCDINGLPFFKYAADTVRNCCKFYSSIRGRSKAIELLKCADDSFLKDFNNIKTLLDDVFHYNFDFLLRLYNPDRKYLLDIIVDNELYYRYDGFNDLSKDNEITFELLKLKNMDFSKLSPSLRKEILKDKDYIYRLLQHNPEFFSKVYSLSIWNDLDYTHKVLSLDNINPLLLSKNKCFTDRKNIEIFFKNSIYSLANKDKNILFLENEAFKNKKLLTNTEHSMSIIAYDVLYKCSFLDNQDYLYFNNKTSRITIYEIVRDIVTLVCLLYKDKNIKSSGLERLFTDYISINTITLSKQELDDISIKFFNHPIDGLFENIFNTSSSKLDAKTEDMMFSVSLILGFVLDALMNKIIGKTEYFNTYIKDSSKKIGVNILSSLFYDKKFIIKTLTHNKNYLKKASNKIKADKDILNQSIKADINNIHSLDKDRISEFYISNENRLAKKKLFNKLSNEDKISTPHIIRALELEEKFRDIFSDETCKANSKNKDVLTYILKDLPYKDSLFFNKAKNKINVTKLSWFICTNCLTAEKYLKNKELFEFMFCNKSIKKDIK